jgi:hypothetical protein
MRDYSILLNYSAREFRRDLIRLWKHEKWTPPPEYLPDYDWEQQMHASLGVPWPCNAAAEFWALWPQVIKELEAKGIRPGPESFQIWNDGDAAFVRAAWCLVRHSKPKRVVETGVAHGVTSRFVLEALKANGDGHLWSIDLQIDDPHWRAQVGAAVGDGHADRWSYIQGSSRRRLPPLLSRLRQVDLFIHDSMHTDRNVRFEMDRAWTAMGAKGALLVDDVDVNWGFRTFRQDFPGYRSMIGEAEPLHPDLRRFNKKGMFGVVLKQPTAHALGHTMAVS